MFEKIKEQLKPAYKDLHHVLHQSELRKRIHKRNKKFQKVKAKTVLLHLTHNDDLSKWDQINTGMYF
jgi:hypothetical protein